MAAAKPANRTELFTEEEKAPTPKKKTDGPLIEYFGQGADKVKFEVDPKARHIRVFGDGRILVDY